MTIESDEIRVNRAGRVLAFSIAERFDVARRILRRALEMEGLRVPHEFDTAARIREELGVGLKQNIVLYVDDPVCLLEATVMDPAGGLFVPQPVVLADRQHGCVVLVRSIEPLFETDLPVSVRSAVLDLYERILSGIQRVALKETAATQMATCGALV